MEKEFRDFRSEEEFLKARDEYIRALRTIIKLDRSRRYNYEEVRLSDGEKPKQGERWLTPAEYAKDELERMLCAYEEFARELRDAEK